MVGADERRSCPSTSAVKPPSAGGGSAFASPSTGGRAPSERSVERRGCWMLRERRFFLQQLGERWTPQDTDQMVEYFFTVVDHLRLRGAAGESYIEILRREYNGNVSESATYREQYG